MNSGDLHKVWEIKSLKKPGQDEATKMLDRIAKQVQPIMRKHKWRVKLLSEFCPKNPSLLGLNVGAGIAVKLRLRRPNREWDFYPYDEVLDTMLHELCHNAHGPHNANFYKLWDELRKECEDLMNKGITGTGEGFDLAGRRLGGFSRQPPLSSLRQTALAAAQKRSQLGSLLPSGPKRLGGDSSIMAALSPMQAAAMAAERRMQDDIWCNLQSYEESGEGEGNFDIPKEPPKNSINKGGIPNCIKVQASNAIPRKRGPESNFVDLTSDSLPSPGLPKSNLVSQKRSRITDSNLPSHLLDRHQDSTFLGKTDGASTSGSQLINDASQNTEESPTWQCLTCTLLNPHLAPICELCNSEKPKDVGTKFKFWVCKFCTLENSVGVERCTACEQWRYSHGAPVAASVLSNLT